MKKFFGFIMVSAIFIIAANSARSEESGQFRMTRSSIVLGAFGQTMVTTATITIWRLEVSSGNNASRFIIYGGTNTTQETSTHTYDTTRTDYKQYINLPFNGFSIETIGNAETRLYWDYYGRPPRGEEDKGLRAQ
jgi:hypothetical protein